MTVTRWAPAFAVLLDLVTAAALLWMTLSDSWLAIGVSAALVASRMLRGLLPIG